MAKLHGKEGTVTIAGVTNLHASSFELDIQSNTADATDFSSAGWEEFIAGQKSWKATVEGYADSAGYYVGALGSTAACVFTLISGATLSGNAIVSNIGGSQDVTDIAKVTYELQGTGALS